MSPCRPQSRREARRRPHACPKVGQRTRSCASALSQSSEGDDERLCGRGTGQCGCAGRGRRDERGVARHQSSQARVVRFTLGRACSQPRGIEEVHKKKKKKNFSRMRSAG
eukprot:7389797-Prymnesium_polylepis.4